MNMNNNTIQRPQASNAMQAAIQTASINDSSMMTYIPPPNNPAGGGGAGDGANGAGGSAGDDNDVGKMDEVQFNASLDALLTGDEENTTTSPPSTTTVSRPPSTVTSVAATAPTTSIFQQSQQQQQQIQSLMAGGVAGSIPNLSALNFVQQQQQQQQQMMFALQQQQQTQTSGVAAPTTIPVTQQQQQEQQQQQQTPGQANQQQQPQPQIPIGPTVSMLTQRLAYPTLAASAPAAPAQPGVFPTPIQPTGGTAVVAIAGARNSGLSVGPTVVSSSPAAVLSSNTTSKNGTRKRGRALASQQQQGANNNNSKSNDINQQGDGGLKSSSAAETEYDRKRRRHDRNLREQQRSQRITQQIARLREVLAGANVYFKPDKHSTLVSVVEYIKQLQARSALLDCEHKKLLDTISKTGEMVKNYNSNGASGSFLTTPNSTGSMGTLPITNSGCDTNIVTENTSDSQQSNNNVNSSTNSSDPLDDELMVFVHGLDYKSVFSKCGIALAVASIDGRFMDCNEEFQNLSGYTLKELIPSLHEDAVDQATAGGNIDTGAGAPDTAEVTQSSSTTSAVTTCNTDGTSTTTSGGTPDNDPSRLPAIYSSAPETVSLFTQRNLSLFNLLSREHMEQVFLAMSRMLKNPLPVQKQSQKEEEQQQQQQQQQENGDDRSNGASSQTNDNAQTSMQTTSSETPLPISQDPDYWSGMVRQSRKKHVQLRMNITLVRSPKGRPKFFCCALTPVDELSEDEDIVGQ